LSKRLSAKEFSEWIEFYNLEPFGWEADCYIAGIIASTIANVHRDTKKRQKPYDPLDFVPVSESKKKKLDPKIVKAQLMLAFAGEKNARDNILQNQRGKRITGSIDKIGPTTSVPRGRPRSTRSRKTNNRRGPKTSPKKN